jgi:hypothetical protein
MAMPNSPRLPNPDFLDPDVTIWQWLEAKCDLTWGSALIWVAPLFAAFVFEEKWRWVSAICIPIGIGLSHGRWRRYLGGAFWIGIVLWRSHGIDGTSTIPGPIVLLWVGGFFVTAFADRERSKKAEEEWG